MKFWQADIHSSSRHTRLHVTTVNCSETLFPWDYEARAVAGPRMLSEHAVLQCAASCRGEEWKVVTCPPSPISLITQSHHPLPSPFFLMLSALSFTRRKCICLRFLWICKIKTSWRRDAARLDAQCRGVLSCLNKQKNFKKAISPLLKVVHFFIITP